MTRDIELIVNGVRRRIAVGDDELLLDVLRREFGTTSVREGCGVGACGACTVLVDGGPVRSCSVPVSSLAGQKVTTIEGLARPGLTKVQMAWIEIAVPQCGYCQSGMIMAATALLAKNPKPTDADIDAAMTNLCRCGTYIRVRKAIHAAAGEKVAAAPQPALAPNGQKV
jgi:isoquinoline 1-oxidoreductase alpha subunit